MADVVSFMIAPQTGKVYVMVQGALYTPEELRALCFQLINAARVAEDTLAPGIVLPRGVNLA